MRLRGIPIALAALVAAVVFWLASGKEEAPAESPDAAAAMKPVKRVATPFEVPEIEQRPADLAPAPLLSRFELQVVDVHGDARDLTLRLDGKEVGRPRRGSLKGWVVPGRHTFDAYFDGQHWGSEQVFEAGKTHAVDLVVGRASVRVRGRVLGFDDQPLLDVQISSTGAPPSVMAGGQFEFFTDKKEVWITAKKRGHAPETVRVEPPADDVTIVLRPSADIVVSVVDASGTAVFDAQVDLRSGGFRYPDGKKRPFSLPLLVKEVPAGLMRVRAVRMTDRGLERGSLEVLLQPGQRGEALVVVRPSSGLEGVVTNSGAPVEGLRVVALAPTGRVLGPIERSVMSAAIELEDAEGVTDRAGRFDLKPLKVAGPDRQYRIYVLGPGVREPVHEVFQELGGPPLKIELVPLTAE